MPRINVLEVRYAPAEAGPWCEPKASCIQGPPLPARDWSTPTSDCLIPGLPWMQTRVVPYERVEVNPPEIPDSSGKAVEDGGAGGGDEVGK